MRKEIKKSELKKGVKTGFWSGILASLCCVGPLVIVLFGLGSVSFALSLSQYRPYFLGLGFLFMIGAIFLHLNKKNKTCDINCFSAEGLKREKKFIISVVVCMAVIYVFALYILVPAISPLIYGNAVAKTQLSIHNSSNEMIKNSKLYKLRVKISGMTCESCAFGIQSILQSLSGVVGAKVSYSEGAGEIIYNPEIITKEQIISSKVFSTYPTQIVSNEKLEN